MTVSLIEGIAATLLDQTSSPLELLEAVRRLADLCESITRVGEAGTDPRQGEDTFLATGKAVSPLTAARCARELARTAQFVRGLKAALDEARQRFPGQTIHTLYAGCGPYCTLILPLLPLLSADEHRFTLVDIHPLALSSARTLLEHFHLDHFIRAYLQADAAAHDFAASSPIHVAVTETMQQALDKEPQVAVSANLVRYLEPRGILVPERITVRLTLIDRRREFTFAPAGEPMPALMERVRVPLSDLMGLDRQSAPHFPDHLPETTVRFPANRDRGTLVPVLQTHIRVFGPHELGDYDCSLTIPKFLKLPAFPEEETDLVFRYRTGGKPGFDYGFVDPVARAERDST
ncbi:MAG: hypothetical protein H7840_08165 [Alphaproteobacteria bacterium]